MQNNKDNGYNVGVYIRLSKEDDDKQFESESITNQKSLLLQYVKENNYKLVDIYIDDGFSGTNFNRPEFNRLVNDIEIGKINMVITKDMSRLGRDYIGTGNLIEKYFPEKGVRYIAVTDNIDTYLDNSNNDIAPFRAIMNDMYAKDISKKIKASLKAKQKEGKWVGGRAPFGYEVDPNNKNHLIINEKKAIVVKRIFEMFLEGLSFYKIAKKLTEEKVKTPAEYYRFEWKGHYDLNYGQWHAKTISDILTNRIYTGDMVQNKRNKVNYKIKKIVKNNPDNFIIVKNTHLPIVDEDIFQEVQKRLPKNVGRNEKKENHLLDGLLYCGDCGHRISITPRRKKDNRCYTICNYYRTYIKQKLCTTHSNNYDEFENVILRVLKQVFFKYVDKNKIEKDLLNSLKIDNNKQMEQEIKNLKRDIKVIKDNLDDIYIDRLNDKIDEEQYQRIKLKLENNLNIKEKRYTILIDEADINVSNDEKNKIIKKYINHFFVMENMPRELIVSLCEKIDIYDNKVIDIKLTFGKST